MRLQRVLPVVVAFAASACSETDRNDPIPPGMSAGSVTIGGASASTTLSMDTGPGDPPSTTASTMTSADATDATAGGGDTDTTGAGPGSADTGAPPGPETGAVACLPGDACEEDGICVEQVLPDGIEVVCSHGTPGEACAIDEHCDSLMCLAEVGSDGVVSTCA